MMIVMTIASRIVIPSLTQSQSICDLNPESKHIQHLSQARPRHTTSSSMDGKKMKISICSDFYYQKLLFSNEGGARRNSIPPLAISANSFIALHVTTRCAAEISSSIQVWEIHESITFKIRKYSQTLAAKLDLWFALFPLFESNRCLVYVDGSKCEPGLRIMCRI